MRQKWNSTSAIIEQQGATEVFELEKEERAEERSYGRKSQARVKSSETNDKSTDSQPNPFLCRCLLYSKRNRQGYTVNEMIHNMEEVNIRDRNDMVNKCRHQKGV